MADDERLQLSYDEGLRELNEAARRADDIVAEQIESIIEEAEREAETIRRDAEREAEDIRREAVQGATRLLDRLRALEFPLGELVVGLRDEVADVSRTLERGEHVDSPAPALRSGESRPAETGEEAAEPPLQPAETEPAAQGATDAEPVAASGQESSPRRENGRKLGRRGRRRQKSRQAKGPFLTSEGHCGVCHRSFMAASQDELEASGWRVSSGVGLCPDCQAHGWQLPEGARVPVRPAAR